MNYGKEFKKFATKHHGVNNLYYDKLVNAMTPTGMTPYIIEERQLNISQLDVFSRLMMDRIIFLGTGIDDQIANIVQAQLLFLESADASKDIQIYLNSPGGSVYAGLGVLLCAGAAGKRSALPHSRVMIHQPSGGAQGVATDMEINLREMLKLKDELYQIISKHSGQTFERVHKDSERDYWMIADEAKDYGMIDEVLRRS